jgi:hypothetical protein
MINISKIIEAACDAAGCLVEDYQTPTRIKEVVLARHLVRWYQRKVLKMTYMSIEISHATAIHSEKVIENIISLEYDERRDAVMRFISTMQLGKSEAYTGKARGRSLVVYNCDRMAIYDNNVITIIDVYGNIKHKSIIPKITVEDFINLLNNY